MNGIIHFKRLPPNELKSLLKNTESQKESYLPLGYHDQQFKKYNILQSDVSDVSESLKGFNVNGSKHIEEVDVEALKRLQSVERLSTTTANSLKNDMDLKLSTSPAYTVDKKFKEGFKMKISGQFVTVTDTKFLPDRLVIFEGEAITFQFSNNLLISDQIYQVNIECLECLDHRLIITKMLAEIKLKKSKLSAKPYPNCVDQALIGLPDETKVIKVLAPTELHLLFNDLDFDLKCELISKSKEFCFKAEDRTATSSVAKTASVAARCYIGIQLQTTIMSAILAKPSVNFDEIKI
ncbi:uncharacterized protein LOC136082508 [Hydra vulgaris]|uniref:Uncharacterized protein LOC136082508 n=1 Tax=Hydra vulgaris TaxID=6087 RepID=A0ABM4C8M9_HYDVU